MITKRIKLHKRRYEPSLTRWMQHRETDSRQSRPVTRVSKSTDACNSNNNSILTMITIGIYGFFVFGKKDHGQADNTWMGVLLSAISLLMDGLTGAQQDK